MLHIFIANPARVCAIRGIRTRKYVNVPCPSASRRKILVDIKLIHQHKTCALYSCKQSPSLRFVKQPFDACDANSYMSLFFLVASIHEHSGLLRCTYADILQNNILKYTPSNAHTKHSNKSSLSNQRDKTDQARG